MLQARDRLRRKHPKIAQRITPHLLGVYFRYIRNLSLIECRLTPDLYTLMVAAQQTAGDDFALAVAETAREYPHADADDRRTILRAGCRAWGSTGLSARLGHGRMVSRLPGPGVLVADVRAAAQAPEAATSHAGSGAGTRSACAPGRPRTTGSRAFTRHVRDQAKAIIGADLARTEKFTTSVWTASTSARPCGTGTRANSTSRSSHPAEAAIEVVVFLFDSPADPSCTPTVRPGTPSTPRNRHWPFIATDPMKNLVGPGIAQANTAARVHLPTPAIPDIWVDPRFDFTDTLEERLLAAAFLHSQDRHVAVVSPRIPPAAWRRLARKFGRKIVHLPLKRFSGQLLERLRMFHVLNGKRSGPMRRITSVKCEKGGAPLPSPEKSARSERSLRSINVKIVR